jgi:hypothetical protein
LHNVALLGMRPAQLLMHNGSEGEQRPYPNDHQIHEKACGKRVGRCDLANPERQERAANSQPPKLSAHDDQANTSTYTAVRGRTVPTVMTFLSRQRRGRVTRRPRRRRRTKNAHELPILIEHGVPFAIAKVGILSVKRDGRQPQVGFYGGETIERCR